MTRVDILLPFYGDFSYLREAVQSVIRQTDPGWRLVVVDDAYPDPQVSKWFQRLDHPTVEYHRNSTNLGANGNYRRALAMSEADRVVFMGADDIMLPNYVATVRRVIAREPDVAVIQPGVQVIDSAGRPVLPMTDRVKRWSSPRLGRKNHKLLRGEDLAKSLLRSNWTYFPSLCWRRDVVNEIGFRRDLNVTQDLALLVDVLVSGGSMLLLRETTFHYRRHPTSDSALKAISGSRFAEERLLFEAFRREATHHNWPRAARAARLHLASRLHAASKLPSSLARGRWQAAWGLGRHALAP